jgi:hypothetical protein
MRQKMAMKKGDLIGHPLELKLGSVLTDQLGKESDKMGKL